MKTKKITIFVIILMLMIIPFTAEASTSPTLYLTTETSKVNPGENISVQIRVKDIEAVYGTEITLLFNPEVIEVTDTDPDNYGSQIKPGNFFKHDRRYFSLQNQADNTKGIIRYAASLLNPAPAAQGNGVVAEIIFRAKATGKADIRIKNCKFGTRSGKPVIPDIKSNKSFELAVLGTDTRSVFPEQISNIIHSPAIFIILTTILSGCALWVSRIRRKEEIKEV